MNAFKSSRLLCILLQVSEEVAKLLELKAQLSDEGSKKFVLKTPKVQLRFLHRENRIIAVAC